MKIFATGSYKAKNGNDYFSIIIDKVKKEVFALKNFSCQAAETVVLCAEFKISRQDCDSRFYFITSGTSIDETRIPKKYRKFKILPSCEDIAIKLMKTIMYDNGVVNRLHPEVYNLKHVSIIAKEVEKCLAVNKNLEFDDEVIECLCTGEDSEMQALVDSYDSLKPLHDALSDFFNEM